MDASAIETGKLIIQLGAVAALYLKIQTAVRAMAGKGEQRELTNDPLHVQEKKRPATMEDVKRVDDRVTALEKRIVGHMKDSAEERHELTAKVDDLRDRVDDRMGKLSDDIREISRAVGRLEGR